MSWGGQRQDEILERVSYQYQGSKVNAGYEYHAFKEYGGTRYKIMKTSLTDDSDVSYALGSSGFAAAWADYTNLTYDLIPD